MNVEDKSFNGYERNVLFRRTPEGFVNTAAITGADRVEDARGASVSDLDGDGDADLVIQNYNQPSAILINRGPKGHALEVRLRGSESNLDGIGARVTARIGKTTQTRQIVCGGAYLSSQTLAAHFGLGAAIRLDELEVRWPSGQRQVFYDVAAGQSITIVEGEDEYASRPFRAPERPANSATFATRD